MTDREWPEYPNQSGGETVTGPESAQEEAASERGWEADPPSPASEECQSEEGSNWERTAQEAEEEVPGGQRGEDLGTLGQAQELQEAFFREEGSEPSQTTETSGWKPGMESSEDSREEPDLPAESPESSGQELQEAVALSPEETQVPFQTENAWEPGAERPENADGGESQEPVAERSSAQPYDQSPAFSRPAPQAPPPVWNPGWQAPYHQAPQNYPYGQGQYQGGWHPQQRQVPPPYYGGTPYQAPNPYQNQAPYGYPGQAARNQGQPGYQESRWYPQQPTQPAPTGSVPPPSQPPQKEAGELPDAKPPEKKRMNKKTKAFLWVIGAVLVLLGAAMVLYSVGLTSGWFGGETAEPPQASSSTPAPEDDQKLLEIEEIPQDGMMTPNQVYEKVKHSVVAVVTYGQGSDLTDSPISSGSGIVFSEDGYIVTNSHVIGDSNQYPVKVVFTGQDENEEDQEYPAQIVGYDKRTDIAVLKIDAAGLTPAEFADSDQLKVGDTVLSLGNPGVAGENFTNTLTKGMVSAVNRTVTMSSINMQYIQTDAAINPGSSGGALLNLYGQVVGINAAKITTTEIEGICFAIPTNIAKDVINDIVKNGYVSDRVRLGVTIRGLSSYEAEMYNVPQGLVIVGFSSDSEIPSKGAEIGDIITAINGVNTTSSNTLYNELEKFKAGEKVKLTIYRQASGSQRARTFEIEVTLLEDTLTKGMVSAVNRTVTMSSINMQYIQTDAAINPGSSGGALLNLYGQVVGINAAKITTTEIEGICFAIPTNIAKDVINDIVKNGYVSDRVRLGVTIRGLSSYEAEMYNVPQGLVIVGFSSDSEIPSKGAEIGDIITAINGVNTTSSNTLYNELEKFKAGEKVKLTIYRQASGSQRARTFEIEVTLLEDRGETQSAVTPTPEAP